MGMALQQAGAGLGQAGGLDLSDLWNVGDKLRAINQEIKSTLAEEYAARTAGQPFPRELAEALQNLNRNYERGRNVYTEVYRTVTGNVPTGLGFIWAAAPFLPAWIWLVGALAVGGLIYESLQVMRDALRIWRERQVLQAPQGNVAALTTQQRQEQQGEENFSTTLKWLMAGVAGIIILPRLLD